MKKYLITLASLAICLVSGCGIGANTSQHNNEISSNLRTEIHEFNNAILKYLSSGNTNELKNVNFDSTIKFGDLERMRTQLAPLIATAKFSSLDDYYIQYAGVGKTTFPIPSETDTSFTITIELENRNPCFVSLVPTKGQFNDLMFTFVYFKIGDTWNLRTFRVGNYLTANRNAVQWYEVAKSMANSNHTIPALLRLQIATSSILRPAPFIQYDKEKEIIDFSKSLQEKFTQSHTFPLTLTEVSGRPTIYYIVPLLSGKSFRG